MSITPKISVRFAQSAQRIRHMFCLSEFYTPSLMSCTYLLPRILSSQQTAFSFTYLRIWQWYWYTTFNTIHLLGFGLFVSFGTLPHKVTPIMTWHIHHL